MPRAADDFDTGISQVSGAVPAVETMQMGPQAALLEVPPVTGMGPHPSWDPTAISGLTNTLALALQCLLTNSLILPERFDVLAALLLALFVGYAAAAACAVRVRLDGGGGGTDSTHASPSPLDYQCYRDDARPTHACGPRTAGS